ncbi:NAD(P)-binding domain-containing protein, partial [Rhizobium ruizarguesonis]
DRTRRPDRIDELFDRLAGNANFRDTVARFDRLKNTDLTFIGMGVSGGEEGARNGPSIMVGGTEESWKRVEKVLTSIA